MAFADNTTGRIIKRGLSPIKVTLAGTVAVGDLVGYNSGWKAADTDSYPPYGEFVAGSPGVSGDVITVFREALIDFGSSCTATEDDKLFVSTTAGGYTTDTGSRAHPIGFVTSSQEAWICPQYHFFPIHISLTAMNTSGDTVGFELRHERGATGGGEVTGMSISARVTAAMTATTCTAIKAAINVKGTDAGTISNRVTCLHTEMESGSPSSRTITGPVCFMYMKNKMGSSTYSGKFCCFYVDTQGGGKAMDGFLQVAATGVGGVVVGNDGMTDSPDANAEAGYIKVYVGSTEYQIPIYNA